MSKLNLTRLLSFSITASISVTDSNGLKLHKTSLNLNANPATSVNQIAAPIIEGDLELPPEPVLPDLPEDDDVPIKPVNSVNHVDTGPSKIQNPQAHGTESKESNSNDEAANDPLSSTNVLHEINTSESALLKAAQSGPISLDKKYFRNGKETSVYNNVGEELLGSSSTTNAIIPPGPIVSGTNPPNMNMVNNNAPKPVDPERPPLPKLLIEDTIDPNNKNENVVSSIETAEKLTTGTSGSGGTSTDDDVPKLQINPKDAYPLLDKAGCGFAEKRADMDDGLWDTSRVGGEGPSPLPSPPTPKFEKLGPFVDSFAQSAVKITAKSMRIALSKGVEDIVDKELEKDWPTEPEPVVENAAVGGSGSGSSSSGSSIGVSGSVISGSSGSTVSPVVELKGSVPGSQTGSTESKSDVEEKGSVPGSKVSGSSGSSTNKLIPTAVPKLPLPPFVINVEPNSKTPSKEEVLSGKDNSVHISDYLKAAAPYHEMFPLAVDGVTEGSKPDCGSEADTVGSTVAPTAVTVGST